MKTLVLENAIRPGASNKQERHYLDFVISGQSLLKILGLDTYDLITPFGWGMTKDYEQQLLREITLRDKSSLETGRVMLYICPECGDIDCGAITANIVDLGGTILWKDFGYETGYSGLTEEYNNIEPIEFNRQDYFKAFSKLH
jgi:hypothetical protein